MGTLTRKKMMEAESLLEKEEQVERGIRIKTIREEELKMSKAELGRILGVSGQFLGLVEDGRGNLVYKSLKRLKEISGHTADYILYGVDENSISEINDLLEKYSEKQIKSAFNTIKQISIFIKNKKKIKNK